MYVLYSFFLFLSLFVYIPLYFVRLRLFRGESLHLGERLGYRLAKKSGERKSLWIHAVSVGEVLSLQNLIRKIKEGHPDWVIHFSSLTNTGMRIAREKLAEADYIFFIPLDFKWIVRRFFRRLKPRVVIIAESEFWPNFLREANRQTGSILLINGRISPRSFKRYKRFKLLTKNILKNIEFFLVQTEKDKENLERIGVISDHIEVAGNLKSEVNLPILSEEELLRLKRNINISETKKVIIAGSIRKGEENQLLRAYTKARSIKENLLFILAPRHPDRVNDVEKICNNYPFRIKRRSEVVPGMEWDILILDTIGELAQFYALSDVAFIGGSLIPWGGHNLLEPAFYGKPIFFGPHMENFSDLAARFVSAQAARISSKEEDLVEMFLIQDERYFREMGNKAKATLSTLQGATEKTIKHIENMMAKS